MATTYSAKGTSYPSFKIHKSGPTLYQGSASPTASARNGDLYLQHGSSGRLWIYSQSAWTEIETGLNDALDSFTLRSTHVPAARNVQYILNGTSTDATEIELLIQTTLSADTTLIDVTDTTIDGSTTITTGRINIPDDSAGIVEAKIIARDGVNNENAGYIIKGVIVNDAGSTVLLTDPMEEILGESTSSWYALMEADDTTDSVIVKASGSANATVKWTAFVNVTLATHADPTPTYSLSADSTTVNEGGTVTFTLTTTNVADSTTVAYTVTGVDANDLSAGSLTGNFTISGGTGTAVFTLAEDVTTEGAETLTLTLDNGGDALDVVITDTSTTPAVSSNSGWVNVTSMTGQAGSANNLFPVPHYIMGASDGSIYVAGREGAADIGFVTKLDTDGNTQWFKQYNDASHFSRLYGIVEDTTGAIYTSGRDYGYGRNAHPSGPELGIISKWTTSGGNTWNKTIKDTSTINDVYPGYDAERCAIDSQNNVWVLGTSTASSTTSRNLLLTKIDSNGTLQAAYNIVSNPNTPSNVSGVQQSHRDIRIDSNDNVYITVNTYEPSNTSYHHALIIKLDSSGTMQWYKIYGIASQVPVYDASTVLQLDSNDNLYIVGSSYPNNNYKPVIYKINPSDGSIAWGRQFSFNGNEVALAVDSQDTLWFAVGDDTNGGVKLFKYDTSGTLLDQWGLDLTVGGVTVGQDSFFMTADANNNLVMTQRKGGGSPYQVTYIKLPSVITAGTFGDLTITDTTETDAAYSPNTYTHTTFTVNDVSSSWETVDYNSGSYAITPLVTPSITDNITTVTGGSGGSGIAWGGERGIVAGGFDSNSNWINNIDYFDITTPGNATDFGDLTVARYAGAAMSSGTRIVFAGGTGSGGSPNAYKNTIDYITSATTGNATDFGDMDNGYGSGVGGTSDSTRGVTAGGFRYDGFSQYNNMDYITIATASDSTTFGNLVYNQNIKRAMGTDGTIGIITSGDHSNATGSQTNEIEYITIQTAGNATLSSNTLSDNWTYVQNLPGDSTHVLLAGGRSANRAYSNGWTDKVEQITVATQATSANFGSLNVYGGMAAAGGDGTYAFFAGRESSSNVNDFSGQHINGRHNTIERMTIATGGTATDHGDLTNYVEGAMGSSGGAS